MIHRSILRKFAAIFLIMAIVALSACAKTEPKVVDLGAVSTEETVEPVEVLEELIIGVTENIGRTNPLYPESPQMASINALVFEGLYSIRDDGSAEKCLAEEDSYVRNEDGSCTWTISIRDVLWHDGTKVTASDAAYSIMAAKSGGYYSQYLTTVASAAAVDTHTLQVVTYSLDLRLPERLSLPIVPQSVYSAASDPTAVGSGPFKFVENDDQNAIMKLVSNENWWKMPSSVKTIYIRKYHDAPSLVSAYTSGEVNAAYVAEFITGRDLEGTNGSSYTVRSDILELLVPNLSNELLSNVSVRKAIAYAIDENEVTSLICSKRAVDAELSVPPEHWLSAPASLRFDRDIEKARQLFSEAGLTDSDGDGFFDRNVDGVITNYELNILTNDTSISAVRREAAEIIQSELEASGLKTSLTVTDIGTVVSALRSGSYDLVLTGIKVPEIVDVGFVFAYGAAGNLNGFYDENVQAKLAELPHAETTEDYALIAREAETLALDGCPTITLYYRGYTLIVDKNIIGPDPENTLDAFDGLERWSY